MRTRRVTKLAAGTTWSMTDEAKAAVPMKFKLAATHLAGQFHRVDCENWNEKAKSLAIKVYLHDDTVDPNFYDIVEGQDGHMYRRDHGRFRGLWPVYKDTPVAEKPKPKPYVKKPPRAVKPNGEVKEFGTDTNMQTLFVTRAELRDDLRAVELKFTRDPQPNHVIEMSEIRKRMGELEQQIVVLAMLKAGE